MREPTEEEKIIYCKPKLNLKSKNSAYVSLKSNISSSSNNSSLSNTKSNKTQFNNKNKKTTEKGIVITVKKNENKYDDLNRNSNASFGNDINIENLNNNTNKFQTPEISKPNFAEYNLKDFNLNNKNEDDKKSKEDLNDEKGFKSKI